MTADSWQPVTKTVYWDGITATADVDLSHLVSGDTIGMWLHTDGDAEAVMWTGALARIGNDDPVLDLTRYVDRLEPILDRIDDAGITVDHIWHSHEDYGDAYGLAQVELGNGPGATQAGLFDAVGLTTVDAADYRAAATLDDVIAYNLTATTAFRDQLDTEINQLFRDRWGSGVTATNYKWGHYTRVKDAVPMPNVRFGSINCPVMYGPQSFGDRYAEFVADLLECAADSTTYPIMSASTYVSDIQTWYGIAHHAFHAGVERVGLWHPAKYQYAVTEAVASRDASYIGDAKWRYQ